MGSVHDAEEKNTMSNQIPTEVAQQIADRVFSGQKIAAIKLYREHSGKNLKEAKEFIESLEAQLRAREPDKFRTPAVGKGCLAQVGGIGVGILVIVLVLIMALSG